MTVFAPAGESIVLFPTVEAFGVPPFAKVSVPVRQVQHPRSAVLHPKVKQPPFWGSLYFADGGQVYYTETGFDCHNSNYILSFWVREVVLAGFKRSIYGTFHHLSDKQLPRYLNEFAARRSIGALDTIEQMKYVVRQMQGKRLRCKDLIA